jgi:hypothetical protein
MHYFLKIEKKIRIVREAYGTPRNVSATARKYKIARYRIQYWRSWYFYINTKGELAVKEGVDKTRHTTHKGRMPKGSPCFAQLRKYFDSMRQQHRVVTVELLCFEMERLSQSYDVPLSALRQRVHGWLHSERIRERRVTHVAQNPCKDPVVLQSFVQYVHSQISCWQFKDSDVVNMDETNLYFDMTGSVTLEPIGSKTVSVSCSGSTQRCTVMLAVTKDGQKLPPLIVFTAKPDRRVAQEFKKNKEYPSTCVYEVQERAWVDQRVFLIWVEKVWKPFTANRAKSYLIMDDSPVHITSSCVHAVQDCGTEVDIILPHCTSSLQVLDVGINRPFKHNVKRLYERFMVQNTQQVKVQRVDVAKWVDIAWQRVTVSSILNTWRSIGYIQ